MIDKYDSENQNTEWKWSWEDEYLKWLCGYANVSGGTIHIGVNDDGYVVGLENSKYLLEALPNKIIQKLGIVASVKKETVFGFGNNIRYRGNIPDAVSKKLINQYSCGIVNSHNVAEIYVKNNAFENEKIVKALERIESETILHENEDGSFDYISITVDKSPFAVSYDGKFYKRSGSTLQLLDGLALQSFLLEKAGKSWDSIPVKGVKVSDLDKYALDAFREKAVINKRMSRSDVDVSDDLLVKNLHLIDDAGQLNHAAILLFHPNPEAYVTGAYIKIAYFAPEGMYGENKYADIIYHDDIHGPLITQIDKAEEIVFQKYLKAMISYDRLQRIETYMFTREMFREMLLNTINHKDYMTGVPIQLSVYDDHVEIYNTGKWPISIPLDESLYQKHESVPHNPLIADAFYKTGEIEAWGTGFLKIKKECDAVDGVYPTIIVNELGVKTIAKGCKKYIDLYNKKIGEREGIILSLDGEQNCASSGDVQNDSYLQMVAICSEKLSDKYKQKLYPIINYFKDHSEISREIAEGLYDKISKNTAINYLNMLCDIEVIVKVSDSYNTIYKINV